LVLEITPCVNSAVFAQALERDDLLSVNLYKYDRSSDIRDRGKWVREDSGLKMQLSLKAERGKRLLPTLAKRALGGDDAALGGIVEFSGISFDEAKLEVELENGYRRSFNIQALESGHPISEDVNPQLGDDGDLIDESLFQELARVIGELG
jgi:hypothetical protein